MSKALGAAIVAAVAGTVLTVAYVGSRRRGRAASSDDDDNDLDSPVGKLGRRRNVTDTVSPPAPDTNDPAPPGSLIVGVAHSGFTAEENRLQNLQRRWWLLERWGWLQKGPSSSALEAYDLWRTFGVKRELRSMKGWEEQFRNLHAVEDWAASKGFRPRREDSSHLDDRAWEASLR